MIKTRHSSVHNANWPSCQAVPLQHLWRPFQHSLMQTSAASALLDLQTKLHCSSQQGAGNKHLQRPACRPHS